MFKKAATLLLVASSVGYSAAEDVKPAPASAPQSEAPKEDPLTKFQ